MIETATDKWLVALGIDNIRTRGVKEKDVRPSGKLTWRDKIANDNGSEVFISFHLDDAGDTKNAKIIYQQGKSNETGSKDLGKYVLAAMKGVGGYSSYSLTDVISLGRGFSRLGVLNGFNGGAGILIEFGSIGSSSNQQYIKTHNDEIGKAIATAVYQYFNSGALSSVPPK